MLHTCFLPNTHLHTGDRNEMLRTLFNVLLTSMIFFTATATAAENAAINEHELSAKEELERTDKYFTLPAELIADEEGKEVSEATSSRQPIRVMTARRTSKALTMDQSFVTKLLLGPMWLRVLLGLNFIACICFFVFGIIWNIDDHIHHGVQWVFNKNLMWFHISFFLEVALIAAGYFIVM